MFRLARARVPAAAMSARKATMNTQKHILAAILLLVAALTQAQTVEYIHTDALGSPIAITNASGVVIERTVYEPYGAVLNRPLNNRPGYTGHVEDAVTGLNYMQQRYYDPQLGRFLSNDPVTAYSNGDMRFFNRYAYAFNNPYGFKDPDGRETGAAYRAIYLLDSGQTLQGQEPGELGEIVGDVLVSAAADLVFGGPSGEGAAIFTGIRAARVADKAADAPKASKIAKSVKTEKVGKFTKTTEIRPGKGPGQSRAEYVRYKNEKGETIRTHKDSYDRAGNFQGRKPLTGGPEKRPVPPPPPPPPKEAPK
jgi:RHS repeat-associated protein